MKYKVLIAESLPAIVTEVKPEMRNDQITTSSSTYSSLSLMKCELTLGSKWKQNHIHITYLSKMQYYKVSQDQPSN